MRFILLSLAAADSVSSIFAGLGEDERFVLIVLAMLCSTALLIIMSIAAFTYGDRGHRRKVEADLKRDMLDRGMSAEEIAMVISASTGANAADYMAIGAASPT